MSSDWRAQQDAQRRAYAQAQSQPGGQPHPHPHSHLPPQQQYPTPYVVIPHPMQPPMPQVRQQRPIIPQQQAMVPNAQAVAFDGHGPHQGTPMHQGMPVYQPQTQPPMPSKKRLIPQKRSVTFAPDVEMKAESPPLPQRRLPSPPPPPKQVARAPAPTPAPTTTAPPATSIITPDLPVDYRVLLLRLSEQYIAEARLSSAQIALDSADADPERYYKLIGMGLSCLETVLNQKTWTGSMPPRQEAMLRIRYATLLYEETDNDDVLEQLLTKSITFCERNKLLDLKYSLQHLCARHMFKSNTKAGLIFLNSAIKDAIAYQSVTWVFALRFLRVSLRMQLATQHDLQAALVDLKAIADLSRKRQEKAVAVLAAVLQAMVHLRTRDPEAVNSAQTALAAARAQQLDESVNSVPQLEALILLVDLACSLSPWDPVAAKEKMRDMQVYLDETSAYTSWTKDGALAIPILRAGNAGLTEAESGGIFRRDEAGDDYMLFAWLSRTDVYMIGLLFSCVGNYPKAHERGGKAEMFAEGGLKMTEDVAQFADACSTDSLAQAYARARHRKLFRLYMLIDLTLVKCVALDWDGALRSLEILTELLASPGLRPTNDLLRFAIYLKGTVLQSIGDLDTALSCYSNHLLALAPASTPSTKFYDSSTHEMLAVLATLNTCLIIHSPTHLQHNTMPDLCDRLEAHLRDRHSESDASALPSLATSQPSLASAFGIIKALRSLPSTFPASPNHTHATSSIGTPSTLPLSNPSTPSTIGPPPSTLSTSTNPTGILLTKSHLQRSIHLARTSSNSHLMAILMTLISAFFFTGQVGEQAVSAAYGARVTSKNQGLRLWQALGAGMMAERFEGEGKWGEAERCWREVQGLGALMPEGLWN